MCRSLGTVNLWYHDRQSSTKKNRGGGRNMCDWDSMVIRRGRVREGKEREECGMGKEEEG